MDNIIRGYWIAWDNRNGSDGEDRTTDRKKAFQIYDSLKKAPYKKIVALYNDHEETIESYTDHEFYA